MALSHSTAARNALANAFAAAVGSAGKLIIYDSSNNLLVVAACTFGAASGGVTTANPGQSTILLSGTADHAQLFKADGTTLMLTGITVTSTTVGTGMIQIFFSASLTAGQLLNLTSVTYTAPT